MAFQKRNFGVTGGQSAAGGGRVPPNDNTDRGGPKKPGNNDGGKDKKNPWLAWLNRDPIYDRTAASLNDAWTSYKQNTVQPARQRTTEDWRNAYGGKNAQGVYVPGEAQIQRRQDVKDIRSDYGSRGLGYGAGTVKAIDTYNTDYNTQRNLAMTNRDRTREDIATGFGDQKAAYLSSLSNAQIDAFLRRSAQYNLPETSIPDKTFKYRKPDDKKKGKKS